MHDINHLRAERVQIGETERKYASNPRQNKLKVTDGTFLKVVPDAIQYEHVKTNMDIIEDIFEHTDLKVIQNIRRLVKMFNNKFGEDMDLQ